MTREQVLEQLSRGEETIWLNDHYTHAELMQDVGGFRYVEMKAAQARLLRFMPYIESVFPETAKKKGLIESDLIPIQKMQKELVPNLMGNVFLKGDHALPISGSVKARGGIHEVLAHAERLALQEGILKPTDNYKIMDSDEFRNFFRQYTIQVGSTGNLGLSIGIMGAKLGFQVIVHMSNDAKEWKKEKLRSLGVTVKEYESDYSEACLQGRMESLHDEMSYFIDDENSKDLFAGYASAAYRIKVQLYNAHVTVNKEHPLFVYLPCGVGGAPGGIAYGMKQMLGDYVHCFFVEPVEACCVTLGMASGKKNLIAMSDIGRSGKTIADGLAVGRPSALVCNVMDSLISGSMTVKDERLTEYVRMLYKSEGIFLEPSACAGFYALQEMYSSDIMKQYINEQGLGDYMNQATHVVWATGGNMVPADERVKILE